MKGDREALVTGARTLGVSISERQVEDLLQYLRELDETNKTLNLTRIPREEYVTLHLLDSLTCLATLGTEKAKRVLDLGTGAGFPGIPIASLRPQWSVTLLDSTLKKLRFVDEAARKCGINNHKIVHMRAEVLAKEPKGRESFDFVVSRAVASLPKLVELMVPLVRVGGKAVAMKGSEFEQEVRAAGELIEAMGGVIEQIERVTLPNTDIERALIVIRKQKESPKWFPRVKLGEPVRPLTSHRARQ